MREGGHRALLAVVVLGGVALPQAPSEAWVENTCNWSGDESGWSCDPVYDFLLTDTCTIDRVKLQELSPQAWKQFFLERQPVIIEGVDNEDMRRATTKAGLQEAYGNVTVVLSSANTISHTKVQMAFGHYLAQLAPQDLRSMGNETLYLFGPNSELGGQLAPLLSRYRRPPFAGSELAVSFGVGGTGSGVPFHVHGHGFSEVLHGRKRWLLYPPDKRPDFDPDAPSTTWLRAHRPGLEGDALEQLQDCIIGPGEVLYFPSMWWHATINIGESVFVSAFESKQAAIRNLGLAMTASSRR